MTTLALLVDEAAPYALPPPGYVRIQYNIPQVKGAPRRSDLPTHYVYDVRLDAGCCNCWGRGLLSLPKAAPAGSIPPACGCLLRRIERVRAGEAEAARMAAGGVGATPPASTNTGGARPRDRALAKLEEEIVDAERRRVDALRVARTVQDAKHEAWRAACEDLSGRLTEQAWLILDIEARLRDLAERRAMCDQLVARLSDLKQGIEVATEAVERAQNVADAADGIASRIAAHHDRKLAPLLARRDRLRRRLGKGNGA